VSAATRNAKPKPPQNGPWWMEWNHRVPPLTPDTFIQKLDQNFFVL
jgi:hypothetical protein